MPLCLFRTPDAEVARLGLIDGERVLDVAAAGGPASLAEVLSLPAAELRVRLDGVRGANGGGANGGGASPQGGNGSAGAGGAHGAAAIEGVVFDAPIDRQEIWAAGVTYLRSRDARMEESAEKSVYDRVYEAERPEIFFKAGLSRVSGPGHEIAIRGDSEWDVPEPELTLAVNRDGEIVGYTVGNDVSSRSIEGENPLYLPQAKVYAKCAALGPVLALAWELEDVSDLAIRLTIRRDGQALFEGATSTSQIHRGFGELVSYLFRGNVFPFGVFLMTGTGIVPPSEFTLRHGDDVEIEIEGVGALRNPVVRLDG